ncbi:MAG: dihydrofolate reductase, partial [Nitrososphaeraceae archaeon]
NTLTELPNATVVRSIREVESHNEDPLSPIFIIGGGKLYTEGVALAQHIYLTIINKDWECDGFLPMDYIFKHFQISKVLGTEQAPDIRFFQMQRKQVN